MENNKNYYCTYNFYDKKGRRLAIFGEEKMGHLEIKIFTCSKKDCFTKKKARLAYETKSKDFHPEELMIPIHEDKPKFTFLRWCNENNFKVVETDLCLLGVERILKTDAVNPLLIRGPKNYLNLKLLIKNDRRKTEGE